MPEACAQENELHYAIIGRLTRDFVLPVKGKPQLDVPGGNLLYSGVGVRLWDEGVALSARVGADYPEAWLAQIAQQGFETSGIHVLPEAIDLRAFCAYPDAQTAIYEQPINQFAQRHLPVPPALLAFNGESPLKLCSLQNALPYSTRFSDLPASFRELSAVHICPLDFVTHNILPGFFRRGHVTTLSMRSTPGYMAQSFWEHLPAIVSDLTIFFTTEPEMRRLFQGRSTDLWEMAEAIADYGVEYVVIQQKSSGSLLYDRPAKNRLLIPMYPVDVVDPTGGMDAFCGGFLAGFRQTYDAIQAGIMGSIAASLVFEGSGAFYALQALPGLKDARKEVLTPLVQKN